MTDDDIQQRIERLNQEAELLYRQGRYEQAISIATQARDFARQHLGEDDPKLGLILYNLALLYRDMGDYARAEQHWREALEIYRKTLGEEDLRVAYALNRLAELHQDAGNYADAERLFGQVGEVVRKAVGEDSPEYAGSLSNLALLYHLMGEYTKAEPLLRQALEIRRKILAEASRDFAGSLNNLARLYQDLGDYTEAERLYRRALGNYREALGEDDLSVGDVSNSLAGLYKDKGRYAEAETFYRQALKIARKAVGEDSPEYVSVLSNLAGLYQDMGDYAEAEALYHQALEITKRTPGEDSPDYASILNGIGSLYRDMNRYAEAKALLQQALETRRRILGESNPDVAVSLGNLAVLYQDIGDYAEAERLYHQALETTRNVHSGEHPGLAVVQSNLAELYEDRGYYAEAEPLLWQALEIRRKTLGEDSPDFASSLNNLAALYQGLGDYGEAERLYRQALEIRRKVLGEEQPDVAVTLSNLAGLYEDVGDYAEAEALYRRALEITRRTPGEDTPDHSISLNNLAVLYRNMGRYAEAEPLYRQALEIRRKTLGDEHPRVATILNNWGLLYRNMGEYAEAEPFLRRALEVVRKAVGEDNPDYARGLRNLAELYAATGLQDEAIATMSQAATVDDRLIEQVFSIGSENQRMMYLATLRSNFEAFLSLVLKYDSSSTIIHRAMDLVLRRKAIGAEALAVQRDAVLGGHNPEWMARLQELRILRAEIAQKTLSGPGPEGLEAHQQLLADKSRQKERLEADLARQIPEMNLEQRLGEADRSRVVEELPEDSVLIEYVRFFVFDFEAVHARGDTLRKPARYLAFLLHSGEPDDVRMIDLGEAEPIDRMIASFRASITGESEHDGNPEATPEPVEPRRVSLHSRRPELRSAIEATRHARPRSTSEGAEDGTSLGVALRKALFDPLVTALNGRKRLFLAPDGNLARLPFEVLPTNNGQNLIDEYSIGYLSVGRDVLRFKSTSTVEPASPLVVADPNFNLHSSDGRASYAEETPFEHLHGTRMEGERIAASLNTEPLLEDTALERSVKDSRSPRVLHLATHGFFLPDAPRDADEEQLGLDPMETPGGDGFSRLARVENPLLRSGLALAGANAWLKGHSLPEEAEDGLLTAEDVTGMDLLATEMVVLSACETGLGEVHVGEGVYGLRRAFVLAGAKTLVMSLWKVPDEQTQELMEGFYHRLLEGQPRAEALREAQLAMKERYPNPLYWGAFICQGDPSPLPR